MGRRRRRTVDAVGDEAGLHAGALLAPHVTHGQAALQHRRRREGREADHIAGGVDVRHRRLVVLVHPQAPCPVSTRQSTASAHVGETRVYLERQQ